MNSLEASIEILKLALSDDPLSQLPADQRLEKLLEYFEKIHQKILSLDTPDSLEAKSASQASSQKSFPTELFEKTGVRTSGSGLVELSEDVDVRASGSGFVSFSEQEKIDDDGNKGK